jgi:hypothetical protein
MVPRSLEKKEGPDKALCAPYRQGHHKNEKSDDASPIAVRLSSPGLILEHEINVNSKPTSG